MFKISKIHGREILDSRGQPTVEVEVTLENKILSRAAVPSGASTGAYEACELRDGGTKYNGKGVTKAVSHINKELSDALLGLDCRDQSLIDKIIIELDGTSNKSRLGANALLGVSLACLKAAAIGLREPLYRYIGEKRDYKLPVPLINILNGGAHANNGLDVQEFMIVPVVRDSLQESLRASSEIFHKLKNILNEKGFSTAVGDEGGFAPKLGNNETALDLIMNSIEKAGYQPGENLFIALDVAATELYESGKYRWEGKTLLAKDLSEIYGRWIKKYPIVSIEDGFSEDDWQSWQMMTHLLGQDLQIVGDDLFVTNVQRLKMGIEKKAANALLVKVNQIGTFTETKSAVMLAQENKFHTIMSHRSGETEDSTIADLAVGLGCQQIKTGSLCRGERTAKYNQLIRISEEVPAYWGPKGISKNKSLS